MNGDPKPDAYDPDRNPECFEGVLPRRIVAFCIDAHLAQARRRLAQIGKAAARWTFLEELVERRGWPGRIVIALEQSLIGGCTRTLYRREADVALATASADFRRLLDAGLVLQRGQARTTRYYASEELRAEVDAHVEADAKGLASPE